MLQNYLKIAWRNLWKNKVFSAINIVGLAIGMAACIMIMLFVNYERSFDGIHQKNIYRLDEVQKFPGMVAPQNVALSMFPMGPTLVKEYPEIRNFVRVRPSKKVALTYQQKKIVVPQILWADSSFLQLFDYKLIKGDKQAILKTPNSIVLTEETAANFFGKENPMGKTLVRYDSDTISFKVTGIIENAPKNSHLQFDGLVSFNTFVKADAMNNWGGNWLVTYLELADNTNIAALEKKFPAFLKSHMNGEGWKFYELFLQPLRDVHDNSTAITHDYINYQKFDQSYTYIFSVIALIVLLIACVNFMNLSTAKSSGRAKEVGIRKATGAERPQLAAQFIGESILLSFIALIFALLLVKLFLPYVVELSQRELDLALFGNPLLLLLFGGFAVLIGLVSGIYPAFFLSAYQPTKVLKGTLETGRNKGRFRNMLVIGQFTGAVFLIIATAFVVKQLRFMQDRDPGFTREQVMVLPLNSTTNPKYDAIKQELLSNSLITAVTASQQRLGNNLHQTGVKFHGDGPVREMATSQVIVDPDYLTLYKIPIIAGRNFLKDSKTDNAKAYIINETLAKELLKEQPKATMQSLIGRNFGFGGMDSLGRIVGVAKDFNFNSLHHKIETLCIFDQKDWGFDEISIRISGKNNPAAIAFVKSVWAKLAPDQPFDYTFLDEHFAELYRADEQVSEIVGILASLAIIISCLGLFGLASFSAERRIKEIGIRKVMGASVTGIIALLSKDFLKLVLIAILIAAPIAWYAINKWLQDFAYRISIDWWVFVLAGALAILIALLTVSFQSIKAALMNPVKSLKTE
ncbi:ABC transporter permease [Larkinella terrae]|uniref:FtsX-like permease family protein n=1 Tax=Larkinella terrae TaxID=2025311 RepID=A0A7K0ER38_9BACT|nr:ABC transporter permease [Larkinella terrae]MRS64249.1 FtsX-like permease family protein [Larkinella terrae]